MTTEQIDDYLDSTRLELFNAFREKEKVEIEITLLKARIAKLEQEKQVKP